MRKYLGLFITVLTIGVSLVMPAVSASAGDHDHTVTVVSMIKESVTYVRATGATVTLTLSNGQHITLNKRAYRLWLKALSVHGSTIASNGKVERGTTAIPDNTVGGTCGYAFDYLIDEGNRYYMAYTGFHVDSEAVEYGWQIYVNGAGNHYYDKTFNDSGGLALRHDWSHDFSGRVPAQDFYSTDVNPTNSYAVLWDDSVCYAEPGIYDDVFIT